MSGDRCHVSSVWCQLSVVMQESGVRLLTVHMSMFTGYSEYLHLVGVGIVGLLSRLLTCHILNVIFRKGLTRFLGREVFK